MRSMRTVLTLLIIVMIPVMIASVFHPYVVEGNSMAPNFVENDRLIVERISPHLGLLFRGDAIVIRDPRARNHPIIIKRIIALPNEIVRVDPGGVTIEKSDGTTMRFDTGTIVGGVGNGGEWTMKMGPYDYYVMGDNRSNSSDSRTWGTIQPSEMIGKPVARLTPLSRFAFLP